MAKGLGHGKVILFGEHFVVHGCPAIAAGISNSATVELVHSKEDEIISDKKIVKENTLASLVAIRESMRGKQKYRLVHGGDLPTYGGLGSSAAYCVALVRAIGQDIGAQLTDEAVNKHAYEGEKIFHGNPSGIDNLMATYGGVVYFKRGKTQAENVFDRITLEKQLDLAVGFTGKSGPTAKMVASVKEMKESDPEEFNQIYDEVLEIVNVAKHSLEKGKIYTIGELMNSNQALLQEIGVSDESNDQLNKIMLGAGALGAKLTGGGGGGCCIALAKDESHAQKIMKKVRDEGFESFCTKVGL